MASDYGKLVEALRHCKIHLPCKECPKYGSTGTLCVSDLHDDAADAIEGLQAEVERLKDSNEELREKQTYIDHYGDKWMTSAKDVPTSAYEHGYMDGWDEAMAKMEVQDG